MQIEKHEITVGSKGGRPKKFQRDRHGLPVIHLSATLMEQIARTLPTEPEFLGCLEYFRSESGMTVPQIASLLGTSTRSVQNWFSGKCLPKHVVRRYMYLLFILHQAEPSPDRWMTMACLCGITPQHWASLGGCSEALANN